MRAAVSRAPYQELAQMADSCDTVASDTISAISDRRKLGSILIKCSWDSCVTFLPTPLYQDSTRLPPIRCNLNVHLLMLDYISFFFPSYYESESAYNKCVLISISL